MVLCIVMHSIFFMRGCSGTKFFGFGIQPSWRSSLLGDPEANFLRKTGPPNPTDEKLAKVCDRLSKSFYGAEMQCEPLT